MKDIEESKASGGLNNLAQELQLSLTETAALVREVKTASSSNTTSTTTTTALSLLQAKPSRSIITFSKAVDKMLGGGISLGELTEICGMPGAGKTQMAMQLCINASLPQNVGGVCGQAVYIDTEGSFSPERCHTMATALVQHVKKSCRGTVPDWFEPDTILDSIHVFRVFDEASQMATLEYLPQFLKEQQQPRPIRLVVIDSIAFHHRCTTTDFLGRTRSLTTSASLLTDLATKNTLAAVAINQMTTKLMEGKKSKIVPALGESWAHAVTTRLILERMPGLTHRTCRLVKSPHKPYTLVRYDVRECGIRDIRRTDKQGGETAKRQRVA